MQLSDFRMQSVWIELTVQCNTYRPQPTHAAVLHVVQYRFGVIEA